MTFHGDKNTVAPGDHALVIERNLFLATPDAQAALTSWGANTRGVTIRNNVAIAPKAGLLLDTTDSDVVVTGNLISDMKVKGAGPASGWKDEGNRRVDAGVKVEGKAAIAPFCRQLGLTPGTILGAEPC
jgi:hypothetical protein